MLAYLYDNLHGRGSQRVPIHLRRQTDHPCIWSDLELAGGRRYGVQQVAMGMRRRVRVSGRHRWIAYTALRFVHVQAGSRFERSRRRVDRHACVNFAVPRVLA